MSSMATPPHRLQPHPPPQSAVTSPHLYLIEGGNFISILAITRSMMILSEAHKLIRICCYGVGVKGLI
ncbi:hypothetical protein ACHQM5_004883 [Ranunculus cassubicifolius]